jgi:hypothetical protein
MAKDGDRHELGDPISRIADDDGGVHGVLNDDTDPARLTDEELRRQLANLDQIMRDAPQRGTPPHITEQARNRLRQLNIEQHRRFARSA